MLSSTGWALDPLPLNKSGEPIYVRFHTDYVPVGTPSDLGFKKGDVALVRKIFDANYFGVARPMTSVHFHDGPDPTPELMKELWIEVSRSSERVPRDKVDVISEESALAQAVSEKSSKLNTLRAVRASAERRVAGATKSEEMKQESYPKTLFVGWDEHGNPKTATHMGKGSYFMGWDKDGQPITGRAQDAGGENYFLGFDENGQPITGQQMNRR